jgi:hypothetical protein
MTIENLILRLTDAHEKLLNLQEHL